MYGGVREIGTRGEGGGTRGAYVVDDGEAPHGDGGPS